MATPEPQLEKCMDLVRQLAASLRKRLPPDCIYAEELEADGFEALVKALRDHDPTRGPLVPYLVTRCRGAMIDGLRRQAWTSRTDRAEGASDSELVSLEEPVTESLRLIDMVADPEATSADEILDRVSAAELRSTCLPKNYERVARARFLQRRTRRDVAKQEGVSTTTIAKVEARIRLHLRHRVTEEEEQPLTPKELKVLRLAAAGATTNEIAQRLRKTRETVKSQRQMIITKLCARNMSHAVAIGYECGLLVARGPALD